MMKRLGLRVRINGKPDIVAYRDDIDSIGAAMNAFSYRSSIEQSYASSLTVGGWTAGSNKEVYWARSLPAPIGSELSFEVIDHGSASQLNSKFDPSVETDFKFDSLEEYMVVTIDLNGTTIGTLGRPEEGSLFVHFFASDNKENVPNSTELGKMILTAGHSLTHPDATDEIICDHLQLAVGDVVSVKYQTATRG